MLTKETNIKQIEKKIGYTFKDKSLLVQAFTRTSFCNEHAPSSKVKYQSNEVLEFFGDGVLSVAIISFLLKECTQRYDYGIRTDLNEGDFSNIKSKLSDKQNLSKSMMALGLQKFLRMGEGDAKLGIENEPSVMEDLFESIVGAIYIDSDMSIDAVIHSVSTMLDMSVYTNRQKPIQSAKNALQEWCADKKRRLPAPRYETLSEDGPDHKKTYMRGCYIGDRLVGRGIGKNFKIADAAAAEDALNLLINENSVDMKTIVVEEAQNNTPDSKNQIHKKSNATPESEKTPEPKSTPKSETTLSAQMVLKAYASSQKKPSAIFKDLGQINVNNSTECRVECCFLDKSIIGSGKTRSEARESSAILMVDMLGIGKKKKSAKKTSNAKKKAEQGTSEASNPEIKNQQEAKKSQKKNSNRRPQKRKHTQRKKIEK